MCGVIAAYCGSSEKAVNTIFELIRLSQIRGKHATGVSYIRNGTIQTVIEPLSATEFLEKHQDKIAKHLLRERVIKIIGHTRYSTSDLEHNQPIHTEMSSLVLNGVITQKDPKEWKKAYGVDCKGKNDAEILLRRLDVNGYEFLTIKKSSMAFALLTSDGVIEFYRNGKRPLKMVEVEGKGNLFVASTRDILERAGFEDIEEVPPFAVWVKGSLKRRAITKWEEGYTNRLDLQ